MSTLLEACVAQYKLNDNAVTTAVIDSQGNYNSAVAQRNTSVLTVAGKVNAALTFNGSSDYINTNATFSSVFNKDFSISSWVKPTDGRPPLGTNKDVCGIANSSYGKAALLWIGSNYVNQFTGTVCFYYGTGGNGTVCTDDNVFADGQETWHHIVVNVQQTAPATVTVNIYFDNILVKTATFTSTMSGFGSNLYNLFIGQTNYAGVPTGGVYWNGDLDNVMIFNRAITTDEIATLWNNGAGTEDLSGGGGDIFPMDILSE